MRGTKPKMKPLKLGTPYQEVNNVPNLGLIILFALGMVGLLIVAGISLEE
jgi:hypothetical protein